MLRILNEHKVENKEIWQQIRQSRDQMYDFYKNCETPVQSDNLQMFVKVLTQGLFKLTRKV